MSTDTLVRFLTFWKVSYFFWMKTWIKNVNNSKSSTSGYCLAFAWLFNLWMLLSICLIFCQFQSGVAYKSVPYKKSVYYVKVKMIWDYTFFHKQIGSGLSPQSCLYFQRFRGSNLFNGCLVVSPRNLCLQQIQ